MFLPNCVLHHRKTHEMGLRTYNTSKRVRPSTPLFDKGRETLKTPTRWVRKRRWQKGPNPSKECVNTTSFKSTSELPWEPSKGLERERQRRRERRGTSRERVLETRHLRSTEPEALISRDKGVETLLRPETNPRERDVTTDLWEVRHLTLVKIMNGVKGGREYIVTDVTDNMV